MNNPLHCLFHLLPLLHTVYTSSPRVEVLPDVECDAYKDIVPTDPKTFQYQPYYVFLFRCRGASNFNPLYKECKAVSSAVKIVEVRVRQADSELIEGSYNYTSIAMHSETKCEMTCRKHVCTKYQRWNDDRCQCECDATTKSTCVEPYAWGDTTCCTCPKDQSTCDLYNPGSRFDADSCMCVKRSIATSAGDVVSVKYVAVIVCVELIVVILVCAGIYYACVYRRLNNNSAESANDVEGVNMVEKEDGDSSQVNMEEG